LCWQKTVRDWGRWKKVASYLTDLLHSTFYSITCTLPWHAYLPTMIWQHKLYRKSTKACRPTKSCILRLGERPKAPRAVEKDLQAGVGFERCYEKKRYPVHLVFRLIWIHVGKQDRQTWLNYVAARPLTVSEESVSWLTSLVLAARASLFPPSGSERGRRTQGPKCSKECLCFQFSISQSDHSQFNRFFIPQLDLSPKVAILGGKAHTSLATGYVCVREQQVLDQQEACQILQEASRKAPWHS
jgi:hypothetical protein